MITDYIYNFFAEVFFTHTSSMTRMLDFVSPAVSSLLCTLPFYLLIRFFVGKKVADVLYIALNVAIFAVQAYALNGGIL